MIARSAAGRGGRCGRTGGRTPKAAVRGDAGTRAPGAPGRRSRAPRRAPPSARPPGSTGRARRGAQRRRRQMRASSLGETPTAAVKRRRNCRGESANSRASWAMRSSPPVAISRRAAETSPRVERARGRQERPQRPVEGRRVERAVGQRRQSSATEVADTSARLRDLPGGNRPVAQLRRPDRQQGSAPRRARSARRRRRRRRRPAA